MRSGSLGVHEPIKKPYVITDSDALAILALDMHHKYAEHWDAIKTHSSVHKCLST